MIVADVNILLAACIEGHIFHEESKRLIEWALGGEGLGVPDVVWSGFIRISTKYPVSTPLLSWSDVEAFVDSIIAHPGYRSDVRAEKAPIGVFIALCRNRDIRGNRVSDAYIACVAQDHGAAVATWDKDFDTLPVSVVHPQ